MIKKMITGGQSGAEQAARRVAIAFGVPTGGWKSNERASEGEPDPHPAGTQDLAETAPTSQPSPVELNVRGADATLWFGETTTASANAVVEACQRFGKQCMPVYPAAKLEPSHVATWIGKSHIRTLNVTGSREAEEPGSGARVERFLRQVLEQLGHKRV
jgi:hypothetical protein